MNIGKQIRKVLAKRPELNQEKLAKLSGVSKGRLSRIINQRAMPSMAELEKIADTLRVTPAFLISDSNEPPLISTPSDEELTRLLKDPNLELSLRALGKLSAEDRKALCKVIQRFAETAA